MPGDVVHGCGCLGGEYCNVHGGWSRAAARAARDAPVLPPMPGAQFVVSTCSITAPSSTSPMPEPDPFGVMETARRRLADEIALAREDALIRHLDSRPPGAVASRLASVLLARDHQHAADFHRARAGGGALPPPPIAPVVLAPRVIEFED